jgi:hypothetical protein
VDTGFIVQQSKSSDRYLRSVSLNGENQYCMITDHATGALYVRCFSHKCPPTQFLNQWLARYGLDQSVTGKHVRLDQGGKLGQCQAILDLFEHAGYTVELTGTDASSQNGPGERPHQTISNALMTMLDGANLPIKFWPYALHHYIRLYNAVPHGVREKSPFELCGGIRPDLSRLCVFGCRIYALPTRPTHRRAEKLHPDARTGIFLGFAATLKNALYYDLATETVKSSLHVAFDEAMLDLPDAQKPPNARMLHATQTGQPIDSMSFDHPHDQIHLAIRTHPFLDFQTIVMPLNPESAHIVSLEFADCSALHRAFISKVHGSPIGRRMTKSVRADLMRAYVVEIEGDPVQSVAAIAARLNALRQQANPPATIQITIAPERRAPVSTTGDTPLHLRFSDIRRITMLQSGPTSGVPDASNRELLGVFNIDPNDFGNEHFAPYLDGDPADPTQYSTYVVFPVSRLQSDGMTDEERQLTSFTHRNLQRLANWHDWDAAFDAQLDAHHAAGTLGLPVPRPRSAPGEPRPNVLRMIWNNLVKVDGTRKTRGCLDGLVRAAPWLRQNTQTYSSCIEQPCQRLFYAFAAFLGKVVTVAEAKVPMLYNN